MIMALHEDKPKAVRLSLYIAIRLACLVRQFRTLLKARVKSRAQLSKSQCQAFETLATAKLGGLTKSPSSRGRLQSDSALRYKHSMASAAKLESATLLQHLDCHVTYGGHGLGTTALYDNLFLQHKVGQLLGVRFVKEASHVLDITTLLLARLPHAKQTQGEKRKPPGTCATIRCEKFIANLEHLLRCLQQAAHQALLDSSLGFLVAEWQQWQPRKALDDDWFTEWPSGRRPLSTTWPWNIKPSLVVLWGVCWKFFNTEEYSSSGQAMPGGTSWHSPLVPRTVGSFDNPARTNPEYYRWRSPQPGHVHGARTLSETYSGAMIGQASPAANAGPSFSGIPEQGRRPARSPYIIPISTSYSASPATVTTSWPDLQNIGSTLREISHNDWQPRPDQVNINISTSPASQRLYTTSTISPYAPEFQNFPTPIGNTEIWPYSPEFPHSSGLTVPMQESQSNYPTPRSEGSDLAGTVCPALPASRDLTGQATSAATDVSQFSRRPSTSNASPLRNPQGQMSCLHRECAAQPPTFSRKCEWTKHMDKHTRPYVCGESGCEKIQGFTYSGGLLRHQREVHKQHGGPKAPRMCPHRDCKRSSGTGFSRKENLNEHLRRVHRGVGIDAPESVAEPLSAGLKPPRRISMEMQPMDVQRKRRRDVDVDVDEDVDEQENEPEEDESQALIKRLRKRLEERDERIKMLEAMVRILSGQNISPSSR